MGVGIPGTGMIGLPIAIALGALIGRSKYQLEVLKDLTPEALEEGIVDDCVDKSIHNLTAIGADGMGPIDNMVLDIMTSKD